MHRLVYRYNMIFHDRNFWSITKKMFQSFKTFIKINAKIILKIIFTSHIQILRMNLNSVRKIIKNIQNYKFFDFYIFDLRK